MSGRVENTKSYDKNITDIKSFRVLEEENTVSDIVARNTLEVPRNISPFTTNVFATEVPVNFELAEKVVVSNCPIAPATGSNLTLYFVQSDSLLVGPYLLSAYSRKELSRRGGFIGVRIQSDVSGTTALVEAFHA